MANAKHRKSDVTTSDPIPDKTLNPILWPLGMILLVVAIVASGALVLKQLGIVTTGLPGCGAESDCGKLADSVWGSLPGINWPVSYIGFSYFLGMLIAWATTARGGIPDSLRWIARLGALASFGFIVVMISLQSFCTYCFVAHLANFGFWIVLEMTPRPKENPSFNAFMTLAFSFLAVSAVIAIMQIQQRDSEFERGAQLQEELAEAIASQSAPPVATEPESAAGPVADPEAEPASPVFTGRYLLGDPDAPVKLVMFSDYQCPDCYKYEKEVMEVFAQRDDVSLSVKHFPFNSDCNPMMKTRKHGNACWAARAAETVGILGGNDAFWKMHGWLFERRGTFTNQEITDYVRSLGIDPIEFTRIINGEEVNDLVLADVDEAVGYGVLFTPMIFINGVEVKWYHIPQKLSSTIARVGDAIASGQASAEGQRPPTADEKLLLDWKDNSMRNIGDSPHDLFRGSEDADIEVVVWGEYTSKDFMKKMWGELIPRLEQYPNHSISYRVFPMSPDCNRKVNEKITNFPHACLTARAIKAAVLTGTPEQAWAFHEWLIDYGPDVDEMSLMTGAATAGLGMVAFQESLNSPEVERAVLEDVSKGIQMRFRGPPAIFVNGRYVPRWSPEAGDNILGRVLAEAARERSQGD